MAVTTMAYPFEITPSGKVATASGDDAMLQQVRMVLATTLGSRVMRPSFGSLLPEQAFEAMDMHEDEIRESVTNAVNDAVSSARVHSVVVDAERDQGYLAVTVHVSRVREVNPRVHSVSLAFGRVVEDNAQ